MMGPDLIGYNLLTFGTIVRKRGPQIFGLITSYMSPSDLQYSTTRKR